jgi:hypothetical protein
MASKCIFYKKINSVCSADKAALIKLSDCQQKNLQLFIKLGVVNEVDLILTRGGIFNGIDETKYYVCNDHRRKLGFQWRTNKVACVVPSEISGHNSPAKAQDYNVITKADAIVIWRKTNLLVEIGSRMYILLLQLSLCNLELILTTR